MEIFPHQASFLHHSIRRNPYTLRQRKARETEGDLSPTHCNILIRNYRGNLDRPIQPV